MKPRSDRYSPLKEITVHRCETCGREASFGLSWPASPVERWFCRADLPADFFNFRDGGHAKKAA